jgi:hypothetical protein
MVTMMSDKKDEEQQEPETTSTGYPKEVPDAGLQNKDNKTGGESATTPLGTTTDVNAEPTAT